MMKTNFSSAFIEEAHALIAAGIHRTPVLQSHYLNELSGAQLFFKCENFQKTGSFKARGALHAVLRLAANEHRFITHSSGNHGQALAWAAAQAGASATVVMPRNAPKVKVEAVRHYGGEVVFCEPTLAARQATMENRQEKNGAYFIPPYHNPLIIAGQATAARELLEDFSLQHLLTPVGGGGLLAGSALSAHFFTSDTKVWAGEPQGANDAYRSFYGSNHIIEHTPNTIADGLLTTLGKLNYQLMKRYVSGVFCVSDTEIIAAMRLVWERLKIVIEPSCAVPLAVVLKNKNQFAGQRVGLILSGGNVDVAQLPFE